MIVESSYKTDLGKDMRNEVLRLPCFKKFGSLSRNVMQFNTAAHERLAKLTRY